MGLVLLVLGVSLLLLSVLSFNRTDTMIDISFFLEPGEKYGPYENGTYYHTRIFSKSVLIGEVLVESGSINFTVNGYNTHHLRNVLIDQDYSFAIDPADDIYTFTFDNTGSNVQSSIAFTLQERWMNIFLLIPSFIGILLVATGVGMELYHRRKPKKQG